MIARFLSACVVLAAVPVAGAATQSSIPSACPPKAVLKSTLHLSVRQVVSRVRPVGAVAQTAGFGAPTAAPPGKATGRERTCTYTTEAAPVTIAFTSPVSPAIFAGARKSTARGVTVAVVHGVGDSAWGTAGGELFVLKGSVEIVITASGAGAGELASLARAVVV